MKIYTADEIFDKEKVSFDCVVITVGAQKAVKAMLDICGQHHVKEVYMMHDVAGKNQLSVISAGIFNERWIRKIHFSDHRPTLPYIEIPITDACNLNCRGCLFACNKYNSNEHVPKEQILKDAGRMAELFEDIPWIRVLGGEPLMHPDLNEILDGLRKIFPTSEIDLCTNGLLLPRMEESFFETIIRNKMSVHVSGYKPTYPILDKMDQVLREHGIIYTILKREEFFKFYTTDPEHDMIKNFKVCPTCACLELYRGRIMRCSAVIAFEKFDEQYGTSYEVTKDIDWYDLHDEKWDGYQLKKALDHATHTCKYCDLEHMQKFGWEAGGSRACLEDYIV